MEKTGTSRQTKDDSKGTCTLYVEYQMLQTCAVIVRKAYSFSTATVVTRTVPNVTLYSTHTACLVSVCPTVSIPFSHIKSPKSNKHLACFYSTALRQLRQQFQAIFRRVRITIVAVGK